MGTNPHCESYESAAQINISKSTIKTSKSKLIEEQKMAVSAIF